MTDSGRWKLVTGVAVAAVLAYFLVIARGVLVGTLLATAVYLISWLAAWVTSPTGPLARRGR